LAFAMSSVAATLSFLWMCVCIWVKILISLVYRHI
jgi:hypothetical protein